MKSYVLGSGSKGNSTLIISDKAKILIDVGFSFPVLKEKLNGLINIEEIDGIIITHCHSDHIKGLKYLNKKYGIRIYIQDDKLLSEGYINTTSGNIFVIKDLTIKTFKLSHDVECFGLVISDSHEEIVYITDTGYIKEITLDSIKNKKTYIIESNHDEAKLMSGRYPFYLKQRIISDVGHLSNKNCVKYLTKLIGPNTKNIVLIHLSEENNTIDLVKKEIYQKFDCNRYNIIISTQDNVSEEVLT